MKKETQIRNSDIEYRLMDLLEDNPEVTQRKLAEELGISLGKTHYIIKQLVVKGWLKVQNFKNSKNKRVYVYLLTWSGISGKTQLTWDFLKRKEKEFNRLQQEIEV